MTFEKASSLESRLASVAYLDLNYAAFIFLAFGRLKDHLASLLARAIGQLFFSKIMDQEEAPKT
jgi:hypothetical protein